jgi:hypothetical protein
LRPQRAPGAPISPRSARIAGVAFPSYADREALFALARGRAGLGICASPSSLFFFYLFFFLLLGTVLFAMPPVSSPAPHAPPNPSSASGPPAAKDEDAGAAAAAAPTLLAARLPHLAGAIVALTPSVAGLRSVLAGQTAARNRVIKGRSAVAASRASKTNIEFEARLGTVREDGRFDAGVDPDVWYAALAMLKRASPDQWDTRASHDWSEDQVAYYTLPLSDQPVRTVASYRDDRICVTHQRKSVVDRRTFVAVPGPASDACCGPDGGAPASRCQRRWRGRDVRVAVSREERVLPKDVPNAAQPHRVAIRQRRRFVAGAWAIDLTVVWAGATKEEAERRQWAGRAEYHIEVECIDPVGYLADHDDASTAASVLMRIVDLVDPEATTRNQAAGLPRGTPPGPWHYHACA